jgi:hypothetical protein
MVLSVFLDIQCTTNMIVEDSLIDWCLAHTLAVFQLYRNVEMIYKSIYSRLSKRLQDIIFNFLIYFSNILIIIIIFLINQSVFVFYLISCDSHMEYSLLSALSFCLYLIPLFIYI